MPLLRGNIKFNFVLFNMFNNSGEEWRDSVKKKVLKFYNTEEIYRFQLESFQALMWPKYFPCIFLLMKESPFLKKLKLSAFWLFFIFIIKLSSIREEV